MAKRQAKHIHRELTPEEKRRWSQAVKETESEKEEILAKGRRIKAVRVRTTPPPDASLSQGDCHSSS